MTGLWLVSYIALWLLVGVLCMITLGLLQQLGLLQHKLEQYSSGFTTEQTLYHPTLEDDGPEIGSKLPNLTTDTINGFGILNFPFSSQEKYSLLVFLSPLCETCQDIVEILNTVADNNANVGNVIAIMRSDEQACRSFINVFPLHLPLVCDNERVVTMKFGVHHAPFGLLYNTQGTLIRKGGIKSQKDLSSLLEDVVHPLLSM